MKGRFTIKVVDFGGFRGNVFGVSCGISLQGLAFWVSIRNPLHHSSFQQFIIIIPSSYPPFLSSLELPLSYP